jgi:hypothetical protein
VHKVENQFIAFSEKTPEHWRGSCKEDANPLPSKSPTWEAGLLLGVIEIIRR